MERLVTLLLCPFTASVNNVLSFLAEKAKYDNLPYSTIGVYKTIILQTHDLVGSVPLRELPLVSWFVKGIYQMNLWKNFPRGNYR